MEYITIPEFPVLRGGKAIEALNDFINELEERKGREFTDRQTATLIKLAKELISYIETEKRLHISDKDSQKERFVHSLVRLCSFR